MHSIVMFSTSPYPFQCTPRRPHQLALTRASSLQQRYNHHLPPYLLRTLFAAKTLLPPHSEVTFHNESKKSPSLNSLTFKTTSSPALLPEIASNIDLSRLDALTFEQTLAYLRAHPEPQPGDVLFQALLDDAVKVWDWMDEEEEDAGIQVKSR
jgi:hypothetical protein